MKPRSSRCLFNTDCNFLFQSDYGEGQRYRAKVLHDYVDLLADSGIDTLLANPNGQVPWHPSKRLKHVVSDYRRGDRDYVRSLYPPLNDSFTQEKLDRAIASQFAMLNRFLDLVEDGVDWLAEMLAAARRRGMAPWVSVRMNDAHGANNWDECYFNCPPQRDPALRLTGRGLTPGQRPVRGWQLCDYRHPAVRDYYLTMIRELVEDYDVEGVELDWNRMPFVLEPDADAEGVELVTRWHQEVRALTEEVGRRKQRRIWLGLRVPAKLDHLGNIGLAIAELARRDAFDFISLANQWQMIWDAPHAELRRRVGDNVAIYGSIDDAPNWLFVSNDDGTLRGWRLTSACDLMIRAAAANKLADGCDGLNYFNFFCTDARGTHGVSNARAARYPTIRETADLASLRGKAKLYSLQSAYCYWAHRWFEYAEQIPAHIERGLSRTFSLPMLAEPASPRRRVTLQLAVDRPASLENAAWPVVTFNGRWPVAPAQVTDRLLAPNGPYTRHLPRHVGLNYELDASALRDGVNHFAVFHPDADSSPILEGLSATIRIVNIDVLVE